MQGIATYHFPQIVWRKDERRLWNPIHKKALKNRPEERVRLRIIEAMVEAGWSKHRISTEEPLRSKDAPSGRTDIIFYEQDFTPKILVECKAESVTISSRVAEQTARYNRTIDAPYLLMSNGVSDHWYKINVGGNPQQLVSHPDIVSFTDSPATRDFSYWRDRGFAGKDAVPELQDWLTAALNLFWFETGQPEPPRFLEFDNAPMDGELYQYFKIYSLEENKIASTFISTPNGGTRLTGIVNRDGENVALIVLNLDLLAGKEAPNTIIYSAEGTQAIDIQNYQFPDLQSVPQKEDILELPALFKTLFDETN